MGSETTLIGLQRQKPWLFGPRMSRLKSLCGNSAPAPCSAHLQVSMCLNLRCPPESGRYMDQKVGSDTDTLPPGAAPRYLQVFVGRHTSLFGARFRSRAVVSLPRQFPLAG